MRTRYDLVFGAGVACSCTQALREAGLQLLSIPFDWVGPNARCTAYDEDLVRRIGHICDDFAHWIELDDLRTRGPKAATTSRTSGRSPRPSRTSPPFATTVRARRSASTKKPFSGKNSPEPAATRSSSSAGRS